MIDDSIRVPPRPPLPTAARATIPPWRQPRWWLVGYIVILAVIAFWPVPVDSGLGSLIEALARGIPGITHARLEVLANVALFVPLGLLVTLILRRERWLALPIAFLATVVIEGMQALALDRRTPSVADIIANTAGACVGILGAVLVTRRARRR